jgi:alpha-L-fucosidase
MQSKNLITIENSAEMKTKSIVSFLLILVFALMVLFSCKPQKPATDAVFPKDHSARLEWWKDARFGMFIHWGPVSLKGTEIGWSRGREIPVEAYDSLYLQFDPVDFDADEWVKLAKDAGMKYLVFTSKHHDGFCNWDTEYTEYNIMNSAYGQDIMEKLATACKEQGLALGFYHSTCDWHHPDFPLTSPGGRVERKIHNIDRYTEYLKNQSVEIIQKYGPLLVMWYDVPQRFDSIRGQGVLNHIRATDPGILVNNRLTNDGVQWHHGGIGDFDTPEQRVGTFQNERPWETCMTIASQWAWKPDDEVKSLEQCLHSLVRTAGGDGNLLFNIGPKPDGTIEPLQAERLREMGQWLEQYGNTIYGTRGGPFKPTDWGVSTHKEDKIFLHIMNWQGEHPEIRIPDIGMEIKTGRLINGGEVTLKKQGMGYLLQFPGENLQPVNTIVELTVDGNAMDILPMEIFSQSLSFNKPVTASTNPSPRWRDAGSVNNGEWVGHYWKPADDDQTPWVEINLEKPEAISNIILYESGQAIEAFEIQYLKGEVWETAYTGKSVENGNPIDLPGVTAQKVRLVLKAFSSVPGIYEFIIL